MIFVKNVKFVFFFVFPQNRPEKSVCLYSRSIENLSRLQQRRLLKNAILDFF